MYIAVLSNWINIITFNRNKASALIFGWCMSLTSHKVYMSTLFTALFSRSCATSSSLHVSWRWWYTRGMCQVLHWSTWSQRQHYAISISTPRSATEAASSSACTEWQWQWYRVASTCCLCTTIGGVATSCEKVWKCLLTDTGESEVTKKINAKQW